MNPAQWGSMVTIFVNGGGLQTPRPADGTLATFGPLAALPVEVRAPMADSYGLPFWEDTTVLRWSRPRRGGRFDASGHRRSIRYGPIWTP